MRNACNRTWLGVALSLALASCPALAQTSRQTAAPHPAPQPPPRPFPEGGGIGFVDMQRVASTSSLGSAFAAKIVALRAQKNQQLTSKSKALQEAEDKLQGTRTVLSDAARVQLQRNIERMTRELQFLTQEAQAEVDDLQQESQRNFREALNPILGKVASAKHVHLMFSFNESGLVWADPALDLTQEVITALDAGTPETPGVRLPHQAR